MPCRGSLLFNITTGRDVSCVEIRGVRNAVGTVIRGSGRVSNLFGADKSLDGRLFKSEFELVGRPIDSSKIEVDRNEGPEHCLGYFSIKDY